MNIHARTLFKYSAGSRLLFVNEPDNAAAPAPRLFLGRTREGGISSFRADLPDEICEQLDALCADEPPVKADFNQPPRHLETIVRLLESHMPVQNVSNGLAYRFTKYESPSNSLVAVTEDNPQVLEGGFEKLIEELPAWQPFVALVKENRAVSVCRSVRVTPEAHEAGVETLTEFRGNGYAQTVVSAWARLVLKISAIPLYSTSRENKASQAVARKLELECYGADFQVI